MVNNTRDLLQVEVDNNNSLVINFSQYFGYECVVTITSWAKGISWSGVADTEDQRMSALSDLGVPFATLNGTEDAAPWLSTFPEGLQDELVAYESKYRGTLYPLLWCISRSVYARELFESTPQLVWLVLKTAHLKHWDSSYVLSLFSAKRTDIISACGLGDSKAVLKLILKLKFNYFSDYEYELMTTYDWASDARHLSHLPYLDSHILELLQRFPDLKSSKLIQKYGEGWSWKEFDMIFEDTLNMAAELGIRNITRRISICKDMHQLTNLHDKLAEVINEKSCEKLPLLTYSEPPIAGTPHIIPITNNHDLHREGKAQHHCIASYHARIFRGEYYAYKVLEPERATLGLKLVCGRSYSIDQVHLKYNKRVSGVTLESIKAWFNGAVISNKRAI
ncbi:PcfJ domain-containing protein [Alkalimarinus alittae]|uniref:PcfJ domain-containing protein n=1 Tax=Alkalimarinus alittae TaxID=2961619 RepID=A0ABY6MX87_9ALTE|nr:PcfJ domain-containing protein [Alkalimarinus alittae]UZE94445.1 PcfJ domain-containing protein [Alkalimarinus alittae]